MKYVGRVIVILVCVGLAFGVAALGKLMPRGEHSFFSSRVIGNMKLVQEDAASLDGVKEINIDFGSHEVEILSGADGEVRIKEYMNFDPLDGELTTMHKSGDDLEIRSGSMHANFLSFSSQKRIEIYIPDNYHDDMDIILGSGRLEIEKDLELSELKMKVSSGKATAGKIETESSTLTLSSGELIIDELTGVQDDTVESGKMELGMVTGNGTFHCSSGALIMRVSDVEDDMELEVSSGKIEAEFPQKSSFDFDADVSSGGIDTYFDTDEEDDHEYRATVGDDPSGRVRVKVSSGHAEISDY